MSTEENSFSWEDMMSNLILFGQMCEATGLAGRAILQFLKFINHGAREYPETDLDVEEIVENTCGKKGDKVHTIKKVKQNNELDDLPPIEDLHISVPEVLCNPLGKIEKIVEQLVIVKPNANKPTLNLDTVLFVNRGTKALGKIFDVFGSVNEPYYCVRFNDTKHIEENGIKVGMQVYYCPSNTSYTSRVSLHELMKIKACDAVGDDEPPAFSDDEKEQAYYAKLKQKNENCSDNKTLQKRHRQTS